MNGDFNALLHEVEKDDIIHIEEMNIKCRRVLQGLKGKEIVT